MHPAITEVRREVLNLAIARLTKHRDVIDRDIKSLQIDLEKTSLLPLKKCYKLSNG